MNTLTISKSNLKEIIYELLIPSVSNKEMADIEMKYKNPSDYNKMNFKDMTDWVNKWKLISVIAL